MESPVKVNSQQPITSLQSERTAPQSLLVGYWRRLVTNKLAVISLIVLISMILIAVFGPLIYPQSPIKPDYGAINSQPSAKHWFGADNLGRDTLARLIFG